MFSRMVKYMAFSALKSWYKGMSTGLSKSTLKTGQNNHFLIQMMKALIFSRLY